MTSGTIYSIFKAGLYTRVTVRGVGDESGEFSEILLQPSNHNLTDGDFIWWQGRSAYWTPADESMVDEEIKKYGAAKNVPVEA